MHVHRSNRIEILLAKLGALGQASGQRQIVIAPNQLLESEACRRLKDASALNVDAYISAACTQLNILEPNIENFSTSELAALLPDLIKKHWSDSDMQALRQYVIDASIPERLAAASQNIAEQFERYLLHYPELILRWEEQPVHDWQCTLWREVCAQMSANHIARCASTLQAQVQREAGKSDASHICHILLPHTLSRAHLYCVAFLSRAIETHLYQLTPTPEYWAELPAQENPSDETHAHPFLRQCGWALAGSEKLFIDLSDEIEQESETFESPNGEDVLHQIQNNLFSNKQALVSKTAADQSVQLILANSYLQEVERLLDRLCEIMSTQAIASSEIGIVYSDSQTYEPLLQYALAQRDILSGVTHGTINALRGMSFAVSCFLGLSSDHFPSPASVPNWALTPYGTWRLPHPVINSELDALLQSVIASRRIWIATQITRASEVQAAPHNPLLVKLLNDPYPFVLATQMENQEVSRIPSQRRKTSSAASETITAPETRVLQLRDIASALWNPLSSFLEHREMIKIDRAPLAQRLDALSIDKNIHQVAIKDALWALVRGEEQAALDAINHAPQLASGYQDDFAREAMLRSLRPLLASSWFSNQKRDAREIDFKHTHEGISVADRIRLYAANEQYFISSKRLSDWIQVRAWVAHVFGSLAAPDVPGLKTRVIALDKASSHYCVWSFAPLENAEDHVKSIVALTQSTLSQPMLVAASDWARASQPSTTISEVGALNPFYKERNPAQEDVSAYVQLSRAEKTPADRKLEWCQAAYRLVWQPLKDHWSEEP